MNTGERRWANGLLTLSFGLSCGCSGQIGDPLPLPTGVGAAASMGGAAGGSNSAGSGAQGSTAAGGAHTVAGQGNLSGGASGGGGVGLGGAGATAGAAGASTGTGGSFDPGPCTESAPTAQRIVRLSFDQVANSLEALLGKDALVGLTLPGITGNVRHRKFQALFNEGGFINTDVLTDTVNMTESALGKLTPAAITTLSGCAAPMTDACAQGFLPAFAEKAYRRPLSAGDQADVLAQYQSYKTASWSVEDSLRLTMESVLISPGALYRTEIGAPTGATAVLTPAEIASQISYFLLNAPPDEALRGAAEANRLANSDSIQAEVDRLLVAPEAIENLNQVMAAYFGLGEIDTTVKDATLFPEFVGGLKDSMYMETNTFLRKTLWQGKLTGLLTSKTTYINPTLASFYGVSYPGAPGSMTFEPFEFPENQPRGGLLTQASVLSIRSRTDATSVVSRGLYVNGNVLCQQTPPSPPETLRGRVDDQLLDKNSTERQKSDFRMTTPECKVCHQNFDQYGLALEHYDAIGRYRAAYPNGSAVDAASTLPPRAGGNVVKNVIEMSSVVTENGTFTRCLTSNLMKYALAEEVAVLTANDCAVRDVVTRFQASDQSFAALVRTIAVFNALSLRAVGGP